MSINYTKYIGILMEKSQDDWQFVIDWDKMPKKYQNKLRRSFKSMAELSSLMSADAPECVDMTWDKDLLEFKIADCGGIENMERYWDPKGRFIRMAHFNVEPISQGQGIGTLMMEGIIEVAKRLDCEKLTLFAVDGGSYFSARNGFVPDHESWKSICSIIRNRLEDVDEFDNISVILDATADPNPKSIWTLANQDNGIQILYGLRWSGTFHINDPSCLEQFARNK